jgi:hypothetical protein
VVEGQIEVLENGIGKMLTMELNPEEVPLDVPFRRLRRLVRSRWLSAAGSTLMSTAVRQTFVPE